MQREADIGLIPAKVLFFRSVGPMVHVELKREDNGDFVEADLSKESFQKIQPKVGELVFVKPKQLKIFIPEDYVIEQIRLSAILS
jgi:sulfate transport system ATP-binding protein